MSPERRPPYRVILWGPGYTGQQALRELLARPEFQVVGCLAYNPAKAGHDVGALVGHAPIGVEITTDKERIYRLDADVVVFTARAMPDESERHEEITRLLRSGKNVVTATAYHFPWQRGEDYVRPLEEACDAGRASLLGTGVHPGWFIERFVPTVTSLCNSIEQISLAEVVDLRHHSGDAIAGMGYGLPPERLGSRKRKLILSRYYFESIAYIAYVLGVQLERVTSEIRYLTTDHRFEVAAVSVDPGTVACVDGIWSGYVGGRAFVTLRELLYLDPELVTDYEITSPDFYDLSLVGKPLDVHTRVDLSVTDETDVYGVDDGQAGANLATAVQLVHTIPVVVAAAPGVLLPDLFAHSSIDLRDIVPPRRSPIAVPEEIL